MEQISNVFLLCEKTDAALDELVTDVGQILFEGPKDSSGSTQDLQRALEKAKRVLAVLEQQASGFTSLTIPAHLQIELEDKHREIADLEADLKSTLQ